LPVSGASFGEMLCQLRAAANMTQEALAERADLSSDAISMLERGVRRAPRRSTVLRLAAALRLDHVDRERLVAAATRGGVAAGAGALPPEPGAGIPPDPVANFVGREAELADIERRLRAVRRLAVHGLGGVGKTQLAARYAAEHRDLYPDGVFWLRAEQESSLVGDLASLAWRLGLPERERPEQERQVEAVLRWLREHRRWLVVLDNLEPEAAEPLRRWLPPGLPGHLLLTSRTPMWSARLDLEPLSPAAAGRFLLERTGQADAAAAGAIAEMLGCLPLALEQAAAYLEASGRDLDGYAGLLRTRLVELMAAGRPDGYPLPLATTWRLSFDRMADESPDAAALLRLCAFLGPDDVPIDVLQAGGGDLPNPLGAALADDLELDRAIASLRRYSLVQRQDDGLRVHRLVQAVVRAALDPEQRETWLAAAIRLLRAAFPPAAERDAACWPLVARLVAHVEVVERLAAGRAVEARALGWLLDGVGCYMRARGELAAARPFQERALAVRERALGPDDRDSATSHNNLAILLKDQGQPEAARLHYERALAIRERVLGPDHPDTAESLADLAWVLRELREPAAARTLMERSLAICERALGTGHLRTANALHSLGVMLRDDGQSESAGALLGRALAIYERVVGPEHPYTATCLHVHATILWEQGRAAVARPLLERALAIRERVLGPDHPRTARNLHHLGLVLWDQGERASASALLARALAINERSLGPEHRWTIESRDALESIGAAGDGGASPGAD
jgi:tetratricopeptide (TPR) repeat protein/DNA-binding XRE family transcriptional regulator